MFLQLVSLPTYGIFSLLILATSLSLLEYEFVMLLLTWLFCMEFDDVDSCMNKYCSEFLDGYFRTKGA